MDLFLALQCRAMLGVVSPTRESWYRHVMRWYSKSFSTPLHEVQHLPVEDVLLAYYEESFEAMDEEEREEFLDKLVETDEERAEREKQEAEAERTGDDFLEHLNRQVEEDMRAGKPILKLKTKRTNAKLPGFSAKDAPPPPPSPEAPVVDMSFDNLPPLPDDSNLDDGFADLLGADPLGPSRRKKK